jgi:hypothetical protein
MSDSVPNDIGFTWGETEELCWLRNDEGEYKRVDPAFLDTLLALANGESKDLTDPEREAITILYKQGYIRNEKLVSKVSTPLDITLWSRLLVFLIAFILLTAYVGYRLLIAGTPVPTVVNTDISTIKQLLLSVPLFVAMALVHETGHYVVARSYFDPSLRISRLNGVFPAIVTATNDAWRCPRSVRVWINLAGPFADVLQCLALAALSLFVFPRSHLLAILPIFEYARILFSLNPLVRGDGYWILVDWFGTINLHTKGMADLKNRQPTTHALYALGSIAFTILGLGMMLFFIGSLVGVV